MESLLVSADALFKAGRRCARDPGADLPQSALRAAGTKPAASCLSSSSTKMSHVLRDESKSSSRIYVHRG